MLLPSAAAAVSTVLSRRPSLPQKNDGAAARVRGQGSARPLAWRNVAVHEPDPLGAQQPVFPSQPFLHRCIPKLSHAKAKRKFASAVNRTRG
jgi:hypothetical protein